MGGRRPAGRLRPPRGQRGFGTYPRNAQRLAEFTDPQGNSGVYPYAAATYYQNPTDFARVVLMPYDLMYLYNAPGWTPPAPGPRWARSPKRWRSGLPPPIRVARFPMDSP